MTLAAATLNGPVFLATLRSPHATLCAIFIETGSIFNKQSLDHCTWSTPGIPRASGRHVENGRIRTRLTSSAVSYYSIWEKLHTTIVCRNVGRQESQEVQNQLSLDRPTFSITNKKVPSSKFVWTAPKARPLLYLFFCRCSANQASERAKNLVPFGLVQMRTVSEPSFITFKSSGCVPHLP